MFKILFIAVMLRGYIPEVVSVATAPLKVCIKCPHTFVQPHTVGVPNNCEFPCVRDKLIYKCPMCANFKRTHILKPFELCDKDQFPMVQVGKGSCVNGKCSLRRPTPPTVGDLLKWIFLNIFKEPI